MIQPGTHRGPALEAAVVPPGPQVRLLDQVLRILDRAEHAVAVREQLTPERLGIPGESGPIGHGSHHVVETEGESARAGRDTPAGPVRCMPSVVILSRVIGFNHADLPGAEKESVA